MMTGLQLGEKKAKAKAKKKKEKSIEFLSLFLCSFIKKILLLFACTFRCVVVVVVEIFHSLK